MIKELKGYENAVVFLISDRENKSRETWKTLTANKVSNVYILEGGAAKWKNYFSHTKSSQSEGPQSLSHSSENRMEALGDRYLASNPDFHHYKDVSFTPKVKLQKVKAASGGCGTRA